jgi:hypothetical protein
VNHLREAEMKKSPYEEFYFQISVIIRRRTVEPSRSPTQPEQDRREPSVTIIGTLQP